MKCFRAFRPATSPGEWFFSRWPAVGDKHERRHGRPRSEVTSSGVGGLALLDRELPRIGDRGATVGADSAMMRR